MPRSSIVVVYGPGGCGKTRNAERLRVFFGCAAVLDEWPYSHRKPRPGDLVLALHRSEGERIKGARVISFEDAMRQVNWNG